MCLTPFFIHERLVCKEMLEALKDASHLEASYRRALSAQKIAPLNLARARTKAARKALPLPESTTDTSDVAATKNRSRRSPRG